MMASSSVTLVEAVRSALKRRGVHKEVDEAMFVGLCAQLEYEWNEAVDAYRAERPEVLAHYAPGEFHLPRNRLLPVDDADERMATWLPWAIARIRAGFARLAPMFKTLTVEQLAEVDSEPV